MSRDPFKRTKRSKSGKRQMLQGDKLRDLTPVRCLLRWVFQFKECLCSSILSKWWTCHLARWSTKAYLKVLTCKWFQASSPWWPTCIRFQLLSKTIRWWELHSLTSQDLTSNLVLELISTIVTLTLRATMTVVIKLTFIWTFRLWRWKATEITSGLARLTLGYATSFD